MNAVDAGRVVVLRRRVSVGGRVTEASGVVATGGEVELTGPGRTPQRERRATIRPDGFFYFLDLPAGEYTAAGRTARGDRIEPRPLVIEKPPAELPPPQLGFDLSARTEPPAASPAPAPKRAARRNVS